MLRLLCFLFFIGALGLTSCGGNGQQGAESDQEGMEQFSDDQEFKDSHETPRPADVQNLGKMMEFDTPDGQKGKAYAITNPEPTKKFLFVIHEWWGLNDNIREETERLFQELGDVSVLALDLYDGESTDDADKAGELMQSAASKQDRLENIIKGAMAYAGTDSKIATVGWCFGGGWSLRSSILLGDQGAGCVMYYGMPVQEEAQLEPLKADVLGLFAKEDKFITPQVVGDFAQMATGLGKKVRIHQFNADHAFANPSSPRYNQKAAKQANQLALDFLKEHLGGAI